jgi:hypothetical protein
MHQVIGETMPTVDELQAILDAPNPPDMPLVCPDGRSRDPAKIPFGHMIMWQEAAPEYLSGIGTVSVMQAVWNGSDYVRCDNQEGVEVWNRLINMLHALTARFLNNAP